MAADPNEDRMDKEPEEDHFAVEPMSAKEQRAALKLRIAQIDVEHAMLAKEKAQIRALLSNK